MATEFVDDKNALRQDCGRNPESRTNRQVAGITGKYSAVRHRFDGKFQIGVATYPDEISRQQEVDNLASAIGVN